MKDLASCVVKGAWRSRCGTGAVLALAVAAAIGFGSARADVPASAYVQDGLVAQWDGVENAGAGQHSNSPTVWKDLKGSSDLAIVNPITVGANCMTISRGSTTGYFTGKSAAFLQALKDRNFTAELAIKTDASYTKDGYAGFLHFGASSSQRWLLLNEGDQNDYTFGIVQYRATGWDTKAPVTTKNYYRDFVTASLVESGEGVRLLANGTFLYQTTGSDVAPTSDDFNVGRFVGQKGAPGDYHSIRLYNRALTAEEIARNRTVDACRFSADPTLYRLATDGGIECAMRVKGGSAHGVTAVNGVEIAADYESWTALGAACTVEVRATPDAGWRFVRWDGVVDALTPEQRISPELTVTVGCALSLKAVFGYDLPASVYVQDGLIAQWDGVENAGAGTHDPDATTWKNLKQGSVDFSLPSGCTVGDDAVTIPKNTKVTTTTSVFPSGTAAARAGTYECYWATPDVKNATRYDTVLFISDMDFLCRLDKNLFQGVAWMGGDGSLHRCNYPYTTEEQAAFHTMSFSTLGTTTADNAFYIDGESRPGTAVSPSEHPIEVSRTGLVQHDTANYPIVYKSARIYNRKLDEDEVKLNAAIDKLRFEEATDDEVGVRYDAANRKLEVRVRVTYDASRGTVTADGEQVESGSSAWHEVGGTVTLAVTPAKGWSFAGWDGVVGGLDPMAETLTVPLGFARDLTAKFEREGVIPLSAYVQTGLVVQYDGFAELRDGKLANLGSAGDAFDLTPITPAKDYVANGWIRTETGWWMPSKAANACLGSGYTVEYYGRQTGDGKADAVYFYAVGSSQSDPGVTSNENAPFRIGSKGKDSKEMCIAATTSGWGNNANSLQTTGTLNSSVAATRTGTIDVGTKTVAYYENGVKISSAANTAGTVNEGVKRMNLGDLRPQRQCYWIGDLGSVRVYNRELTADEIARNARVDRARFGAAGDYRYSSKTGIEARMSIDYDATRGTVELNGEPVAPGTETWLPLDGQTESVFVAKPLGTNAFGGWDVDSSLSPDATLTLKADGAHHVRAIFGLPSACVVTSGSECFLTDVSAGPQTRVEMGMALTSVETARRQQRFFGATAAGDSLGFSFGVYQSAADKFMSSCQDGKAGDKDGGLLLSKVLNRRLVVSLDAPYEGWAGYRTDVVDADTGASYASSTFIATRTQTANRTIGIACDMGTGAPANLAKMKIYFLRVFEEGRLIRCYVPHWDDGKTTVTLKELFSGDILSNAGSGKPACEGMLPADASVYLPDGYRHDAETDRVQVRYDVSVNMAAKGTVTCSAGAASGWLKAGTSLTLTATPAAGCHFVRWEGLDGADASAAEVTVWLDRPRTVRAVFAADGNPVAEPACEHVSAKLYVQDGLIVQYDAGSALTQDGKLANLGSSGALFDLTPITAAKDYVANGWIHTETGWWMPAALDTAVKGTGYTIECCGRQTGNGAGDASYYFMVGTSVNEASTTGNEGIAISLGTAGVNAKGMNIGGLTAAWNGSSYKPEGTVNGSVLATRSGTVDASGSKMIAYYENGTARGSSASAGTDNLGIRRVNLGDLRGKRGCYWKGDIGSVRIYNRVLTPEEIAWNAGIDRVRFMGGSSDLSVDPSTRTIQARLTYEPQVGGKVLLDGEEIVAADSFIPFAAHTLRAVPDAGYVFSHWQGALKGEPDAEDACTYHAEPGPVTVHPVFRRASNAAFQLTAADYVQKDLLFLYDAKENAKPMVHEPGGNVWFERFTGKSFALPSAQFTNGVLRVVQATRADFNKVDATAYQTMFDSGLYTMEACYEARCMTGPCGSGGTSSGSLLEWGQECANVCHAPSSKLVVKFSNSKAAAGNEVSVSVPFLSGHTLSAVGFGTCGVMYTNGVWTARKTGLTQAAGYSTRSWINGSWWGSMGINGNYLRVAAYKRPLERAEMLHNATVDAVRYRGDDRVRYAVMSAPRPEEGGCDYGTPTPAYGSYCAQYGEQVTFSMSGLSSYDLDGVVAVDLGEGLRAALKGYVVSNAYGVVAEDASPSATSVTLAMTNLGTSVCWRFADQALLTLTAPPVGGTVQIYDLETGDPITAAEITARAWFDTPAHVGIRAVPDADHKFMNWSGATAYIDDPAAAETGITLEGTLTAAPVFAEKHHVPCDVHWKDGLAEGSWNDGNSWANGQVPAEGDTVYLPSSAVISLDAKTAHLKAVYAESDDWLEIDFANWGTAIEADTISLNGSVCLTCAGGFTSDSMSNRVWLVAHDLTIGEGAMIDVTGGGYAMWDGPGFVKGDTDAANQKRGGSHGGRQGVGRSHWQTLAPGTIYGAPDWPTEPGSGGGALPGGGAVFLQATNVVMNGQIVADSAPAEAPGSGGSVLIDCETITGNGSISASAYRNIDNAKVNVDYGGGAGGRIAIRYDVEKQSEIDGFAISCEARGTAKAKNTADLSWVSGDMGTVWFSDARYYAKDLPAVVHSGRLLADGWTEWTVPGDLDLTGKSVGFADGFALTVGGDLTLAGAHMYGAGLELSQGTLAVGGNVSVTGASLKLLDGTRATVAGDLVETALAENYAWKGAQVWLQATPTNGATVAAVSRSRIRRAPVDGVTATLDVGGRWTMGNNTYYLPLTACKDGAIVRATAGRFEMSEGALVEARRCGMLPGYGPGRAVDHNHGASYGGKGYSASYGVYGKERWPVWSGGAGAGSAGPGMVWIEADRMSISGRILANGAAGGVWTCSAAGGGIFLVATSAIDLSGATVDARSPNVTVMLNEPAGGGRIAIWSGAPVVTNELTVISADAGKDLYNDSPHEAGNGTVYYGTIGGFRILVR